MNTIQHYFSLWRLRIATTLDKTIPEYLALQRGPKKLTHLREAKEFLTRGFENVPMSTVTTEAYGAIGEISNYRNQKIVKEIGQNRYTHLAVVFVFRGKHTAVSIDVAIFEDNVNIHMSINGKNEYRHVPFPTPLLISQRTQNWPFVNLNEYLRFSEPHFGGFWMDDEWNVEMVPKHEKKQLRLEMIEMDSFFGFSERWDAFRWLLKSLEPKLHAVRRGDAKLNLSNFNAENAITKEDLPRSKPNERVPRGLGPLGRGFRNRGKEAYYIDQETVKNSHGHKVIKHVYTGSTINRLFDGKSFAISPFTKKKFTRENVFSVAIPTSKEIKRQKAAAKLLLRLALAKTKKVALQ